MSTPEIIFLLAGFVLLLTLPIFDRENDE